MAVTQTDIDNLNSAIALGEKQVILDGKSVTYRSIADLITARNDLQESLNIAAQAVAPKRRPKQITRVYAGRGYHCE